MDIITAFRQAVINCSNPEIKRMIQSSMEEAKERFFRHDLRMSSTEALRNQKSLELSFLYAVLDNIESKLLNIRSRLTEFSSIPTEELKRDITKYEKRLTSIIDSIEKTEEEFSHILELLNSCFDSVLNGPAK